MTRTATARPNLTDALLIGHIEAHELLAALADKIDGIDHETADWGHVGNLGHYIARLGDLVYPETGHAAPTMRDLCDALLVSHYTAHELLQALTDKVDGIDPETAEWGHVGNLGHYTEVLRDLVDPA